MRKLSIGLTVAALALAGAIVAPAGAQIAAAQVPASAVVPGAYSLSNVQTAKNLHVNGVSLASGTKIVEDAPRNTAGQSWWIGQKSPGVYKLSNTNSGLCLQDAATSGQALIQATCSDSATQQWNLTPRTGGYALINVASGRAADVADSSSTDVVSSAASEGDGQRWVLSNSNLTRVTAWGTSLTSGGRAFTDQTIRMVVRPNVAGQAQRITLSNRFGTAPLVVGAATVAQQSNGLTAAATPQAFSFGGSSSVTIPAGAEVVSDALNVPVRTDSKLLVSVFVSGTIAVSSFHNLGIVSNGIGNGNLAAETANTNFTQGVEQYFFLKGIDVITANTKGSMVALGDSITDGWGSTRDNFNNWPAQLADRINASGSSIAMVNAGISSNRLTFDDNGAKQRGMAATTRFAYDVAAVPGVKSVFLFEGINDIPDGANADRLIAGYRNVIAQARNAGLKIYGATMTPTKGVASFTTARELVRTTANNWIMTSGEFDGVVDFSAVVADPADKERILPVYDSGDKIHLSVAGYRALAAAADVAPVTRAFTPAVSGPSEAVTAGGTAQVSATGFAPNEAVTLSGPCLTGPVTAATNDGGTFETALTVAENCAEGEAEVRVVGDYSKVPVTLRLAIAAVPTTEPATAEPTTEAPTTEAPTTEAPTTEPTTVEPTTEAPTTNATTEPTTEPTSAAPAIQTPAQTSPQLGAAPTTLANSAPADSDAPVTSDAPVDSSVGASSSADQLAITGASSNNTLLLAGILVLGGSAAMLAMRHRGRRS